MNWPRGWNWPRRKTASLARRHSSCWTPKPAPFLNLSWAGICFSLERDLHSRMRWAGLGRHGDRSRYGTYGRVLPLQGARVTVDVCPYADSTLLETLVKRNYKVSEFANAGTSDFTRRADSGCACHSAHESGRGIGNRSLRGDCGAWILRSRWSQRGGPERGPHSRDNARCARVFCPGG